MPKAKLRLPVGRYSIDGSRLRAPPTAMARARTTTRPLFTQEPARRPTKAAIRPRIRSAAPARGMVRPSACSLPRKRTEKLGITSTDTTSETITASEMATAMSRRISPTSSCQAMIGMKTTAVVRVPARIAPQTSLVPRSAAMRPSGSRFLQVSMFSSTTIALSTTMPTAKVMPARETTLMVRPTAAIPRAVPREQMGMAMLTRPAARMLPKKSRSTQVARRPPRKRFERTSSRAASM